MLPFPTLPKGGVDAKPLIVWRQASNSLLEKLL
jgi:hypothetical protein